MKLCGMLELLKQISYGISPDTSPVVRGKAKQVNVMCLPEVLDLFCACLNTMAPRTSGILSNFMYD
jgi:hypothetical protein